MKNYKIEKSDCPVYIQIYKKIKEDIISGTYPYNTKLPSKRLLATETETSIITVEHAYNLLCEEGYRRNKLSLLRDYSYKKGCARCLR
jgi:GntR family transcriptional regulator/MocR family aminotransferase